MFVTKPVLDVVSQPFKRSQLGLFHGKMKQYGNNVPFSKHKTRRTWLPNVQRKRIHSETLGTNVRVKVTTRALKTIKKHGGLDNYLNNTRHELLGHEGLQLRLAIREHQQQKSQRALEEQLKTPAGAASYARQQRESALLKGKQPTIDGARKAREEVGKLLGLEGPASASQTIEHLRMKSIEQGLTRLRV